MGMMGIPPMEENTRAEGDAEEAQGGENVFEEKAPLGTPLVRVLISLGVTAIVGFIYFYFQLPVLNFHSQSLYLFLFWLCVTYSISMLLLKRVKNRERTRYVAYIKKQLPVPFFIVLGLAAILLLGSASGWALFRANAYANLLTTENGDFAEEVAEIRWSQIPMLDSTSANNLANRKLGELSDLVSQFAVNNTSAQINYKGKPVRVIYLDYDSFFKWWNNRDKGIPAYMIVDMVTQEVTVRRLEEGIKYSPSEYFNRNLERALRFAYPTKIFGDVNFEIDEDGVPYWVASVFQKKVGLFSGDDVVGAVLMNAVTGESEYYDVADVPVWVDRVYSAELIVQQYNYKGEYVNGFFNSLFGQTDCTEATDGYNYIAMNDDVWLYTGITSISGDRGNIGFILVNQRTKEARYYSCAGAEEYSAMSSAEGAVQQYAYDATFPLLLNISGEPTYFMALKDTAGLVKMYAMVNVQQYQVVAIGNSIETCQENYRRLLLENGIHVETPEEPVEQETWTAEGVIEEIRSAAMEGDTQYFIRLTGETRYFVLNARENPLAVILNTGDSVVITVEGAESGDELIWAKEIARK